MKDETIFGGSDEITPGGGGITPGSGCAWPDGDGITPGYGGGGISPTETLI